MKFIANYSAQSKIWNHTGSTAAIKHSFERKVESSMLYVLNGSHHAMWGNLPRVVISMTKSFFGNFMFFWAPSAFLMGSTQCTIFIMMQVLYSIMLCNKMEKLESQAWLNPVLGETQVKPWHRIISWAAACDINDYEPTFLSLFLSLANWIFILQSSRSLA